MKTQHTPGPWTAILSDEQQPQILYHGIVCILERSPERWISVVADNGYANDSAEMLEANARLIAVSPDLYEACERMVKYWDSYHGGFGFQTEKVGDFVHLMRVALDKAKGVEA